MALVHGGGSFALFCPTVFEYLHGVEPSHLIANIDEVPDQSVRDTLQDVSYMWSFCMILNAQFFQRFTMQQMKKK